MVEKKVGGLVGFPSLLLWVRHALFHQRQTSTNDDVNGSVVRN